MCVLQSGILFKWEIFEGKERMKHKEFIKYKTPWPGKRAEPIGKGPATAMRMVQEYFHTGR